MHIHDIEPFIINFPLDKPLPRSAVRPETTRLASYLIRLTADDGTHGWGEAWIADEANFSSAADRLGELLIGQHALDRALLWDRMAAVAAGKTAKNSGPDGPRDYYAVLSAIDTALWDLAGKSLQKSVARLLGGVRSRLLDTYVTGLYLEAPAELVRKAEQIVKRGFHAIKMKLGGNPDEDIHAVAAVRKALGNQIVLMADANGAYDDYDDALRVGIALGKRDIYWFEEPFPAGRWDDYAALCNALQPPLAGGETLFGITPFHHALQKRAFHIIMPDVRLCGGITAAYFIGRLASLYEVRLSLHSWISPIALMAAANISAALPFCDRLELEGSQVAIMQQMFDHPPQFDDGFLRFEDRVGLGFDISEKFLQEYATPLRN